MAKSVRGVFTNPTSVWGAAYILNNNGGQALRVSHNLPWYRTSDYATLNALVAAAGAGPYLVVADAHVHVTANLTTGAGIQIRFEPGVSIEVDNTFTWTINSPSHLHATGRAQLFTFGGTGAVAFTEGGIVPAEWFGVTGASDEDAINRAITALPGGTVNLLGAAYATDGSINMKTGVNLRGLAGGNGSGGTTITYSAAGSALVFSGVTDAHAAQFNIVTSHDDAHAIQAGNACRRIGVFEVYAQGTSALTTTGSGFYLDAGAGWSGGLAIRDCYMLGYKYGIRFVGTHLANNTWSAVDCANVWLVGRAAGHVAGSAGVSFDAFTNGVGSRYHGGTIESFATGILHVDGGTGADFVCDIEDCDTDWSLGTLSWNNEIRKQADGDWIWRRGNAAVSMGAQQHIDGVLDVETRYSQRHTIYNFDATRYWGVYAGPASHIGGGAPTFAGGIVTTGADTPESSQIGLFGHRMTWGSAAPASGTWARGDICWNTAATCDVFPGWICNSAGAPGTWVPLLRHGETTHDYAAGAADWNMTAAEAAATYFVVTNANAPANAIIPAASLSPGKIFVFYNNSGQTITVKIAGQAGSAVANGKKALFTQDFADVVEIYEQP